MAVGLTIIGTSGADIIAPDAENPALRSTNDDDVLRGEAGDDTLVGGGGGDSLLGGTGADSMAGGLGDDLYNVDNIGDTVSENAGEGTDTIDATVSYTLPDHVEHLVQLGSAVINATGNSLANNLTGNGSANTLIGGGGADALRGNGGDDVLHGDEGQDYLSGGTGADQLYGGADADQLYGGDGSDTLTGGGGDDFIDGGAGDDIVVYAGVRSAYTFWMSGGDVRLSGGQDGSDTIRNVERFQFSDVIYTLAQLQNTVDKIAPTLNISFDKSSLSIGQSALATFQFSEAVTGFDAIDVTTANGVLSAFTKIDSDTWTAMVTPVFGATGQLTVSVAAGGYIDMASNAGTAGLGAVAISAYSPPRLLNDPADRVLTQGQAALIDLPPDTFSGVTPDTAYSAVLASGAPLPSWLSFDPATGDLTVAANAPLGTYDVLITAERDGVRSAPAVETLVITGAPELTAPLLDRAYVNNAAFTFSVPAGAFRAAGDVADIYRLDLMGAIDSLTDEIGGATYVSPLMASLRGDYGDGGPGYQAFTNTPAASSASGRLEYLNGITGSPGLERYSVNGRGINMTGADGREAFAWNPQTAWDTATLYYLQQPDGGTMTIRGAGGGASMTVNTAGPLALRSVTVRADRGQSDSALLIEGMTGHITAFGADFELDDGGASFSNIAVGGASLANWALLDRDFRRDWFAALAPDAYVLNAGMNDRGALSGAQYKLLVAEILDDFAAASPQTRIILVGSNDVGSGRQEYLEAYRTALEQLAQERGLTYFSDMAVLGAYTQAAAAGYMLDLVHPSALGNAKRADALLNFLGIDENGANGGVEWFANGAEAGITYSATLADGSPLPGWLTFDPITGRFSASAATKPTGDFEIRVTASSNGASVSDIFVLHIAADQTLNGTSAGETLTGDVGVDTLFGFDGGDVLRGGAGGDFLEGGAGADRLEGQAGFDFAQYFASNLAVAVNLDTGKGSGGHAEGDTLVGIEGLYGSSYNDILTGDANYNDINGGNGDDQIFGGLGSDVLRGGSGNDLIDGGGGAEYLMAGGAGDDTYWVDNVGDIVSENAGEGTDTVNSSVAYTLTANVENLTLVGGAAISGTGNSLANRIVGNNADNTLTGGDGADTLRGEGGSDTLLGGSGDDYLSGGAGVDMLVGGTGDDLYNIDNTADAIVEKAGEGTDTVDATASYTLSDHLENLVLLGSSAIDGVGNALANSLYGNEAANVLSGGDGADALRGAGGNDTLNGDAGDDYLSGGAGDDLLTGGAGADQMYGGAGADRFIFKALSDFAPSAMDLIGDFSSAQMDKIDLAAIDADIFTPGDQAFTFIGTNAFSGKAGELAYAASGTTAIVIMGDLNGDKTADFRILIVGTSIASTDFWL